MMSRLTGFPAERVAEDLINAARSAAVSGMTIREPEFVELATASGPMRTHVYRPSGDGRYPGLLLFSEIFQVTAPIRRTAAFLAGHGFIVAVPEIYHEFEPAGTVLAYDQAGADRGNALKTTKELQNYDADARAVLEFLRGHERATGQVGTIGICIGGHLAFRAAMNPGVNAAVCFYATDIHKRGLAKGMNDNSLDRVGEIKGELLMIWGRQDPHVPAEGRANVYQALVAAGGQFYLARVQWRTRVSPRRRTPLRSRASPPVHGHGNFTVPAHARRAGWFGKRGKRIE